LAEQAIQRFNQQPFMGRPLSVSEARPREERPAGGYRPAGPGGFSGGPPRPGGGGGFGGPPRPGGGGFGGPRPPGPGGPGGFRSSGPPGAAPAGRFGPPKKKSASSEKRWESKERGPKGPIKERYTGRLGGLYDDDSELGGPPADFDDIASSAPQDDDEKKD
jgi:hypothetical protein